jgi:hypothetical protein
MIRIYLNPDPTDEKGPMHDFLKRTPCKEGYYYKGIRISQDRSSGIWYVESQNVTDEISPLIFDLVDFVTLEEVFTADAKRELGIYEQDTAKAELRSSPSSNHYILHIRSTKWKDLCDLHVAIRSGKIRPKESYEKPQDGLSYEELEQRKSELEGQLSKLNRLFDDRGKELLRLLGDFSRMYYALAKKKWPWCSNKNIMDQVKKNLGDLWNL